MGLAGTAVATGCIGGGMCMVQAAHVCDRRGCFAGSTTVELESGGNATLDRLRIGDRVRVGTDAASGAPVFEPVYSWAGEQRPRKRSLMAHLHFVGGARPLVLTGSHWAVVRGAGGAPEHRQARDVRAGDRLVLAGGGGSAAVTRNELGWATGSFHPATPSGTIVVDGVLATTYDGGGAGIPAWLTHYAVTPFRLLARAVPASAGWWARVARAEPWLRAALYAPVRWAIRWAHGAEALAAALPPATASWAGAAVAAVAVAGTVSRAATRAA